jgi:hypothetical protein
MRPGAVSIRSLDGCCRFDGNRPAPLLSAVCLTHGLFSEFAGMINGRDLLNDSIPIIEKLYCWVTGKGFSIRDSQDIDQKNAEALWNGCKFDVPR